MHFQIACTSVFHFATCWCVQAWDTEPEDCMLRSGTMAVRGATLLAMLCLLSTFAAGRELLDADKKHSGKGKHKFNVGSLVRIRIQYGILILSVSCLFFAHTFHCSCTI